MSRRKATDHSEMNKRILMSFPGKIAAEVKFATMLTFMIAGAAVLAAGPIGAQTTTPALPSFEVVSIKPNHSGNGNTSQQFPPGRFLATNTTIRNLIKFAYNIKSDDQLSTSAHWIDSDGFDIDAKIEESQAQQLQKLPRARQFEQIRLMVRSLLEDRFQLKVNHETKELSVLALVIAKNGPKLAPTSLPPVGSGGTANGGATGGRVISLEKGKVTAKGQSIAALTGLLSGQLSGRIVLDQTGLKGEYDFTLVWSPDVPLQLGAGDENQGTATAPLPDSTGVSLFAALQEQLGLKIESKKSPMDTISIAHIEKPSGN
jgi:uncharacterized protein (TIGR03435 family)